MHDEARALEMLEEARAEAGAFVRAFDEPGNIGDHEGAARAGRGVGIGRDNAEMRLESSEGISGNFGTRRGNARYESGFSGVGKADEADVREKLQLHAK